MVKNMKGAIVPLQITKVKQKTGGAKSIDKIPRFL
jgi:hypothetical protein